jgi:hypothetical protein
MLPPLASIATCPRIGPSAATKLLFQAGVVSLQGPCVTLDGRVASVVVRPRFRSDFIYVHGNRYRQTKSLDVRISRLYGDYLRDLERSSSRHNVTPLQVEQYLFGL